MAVLPIFCCYVLFLESKWQRQEGVFTESSRLRNVVVIDFFGL